MCLSPDMWSLPASDHKQRRLFPESVRSSRINWGIFSSVSGIGTRTSLGHPDSLLPLIRSTRWTLPTLPSPKRWYPASSVHRNEVVGVYQALPLVSLNPISSGPDRGYFAAPCDTGVTLALDVPRRLRTSGVLLFDAIQWRRPLFRLIATTLVSVRASYPRNGGCTFVAPFALSTWLILPSVADAHSRVSDPTGSTKSVARGTPPDPWDLLLCMVRSQDKGSPQCLLR